MLKFIILGEENIDKTKVIDSLINLPDSGKFNIAKVFTTNDEFLEGKNLNYYYKISNEDFNICYKNNAIFYVKTKVYINYGVTLDAFYENNIIFMNTEDFNNISNKIFQSNNEIVIIWLDTKKHQKKTIKREISETNYLVEKITSDNMDYMYFLDTDPLEVAKIINLYNSNPEIRRNLLEEYS